MAAWRHTTYWNAAHYAEYRKYVEKHGPGYEGKTPDCADLSMALIIQFAQHKGLPLTFWDMNRVRYISKSTGQYPSVWSSRNYEWRTWQEYRRAVWNRVNARALYHRNTMINPHGPEIGDLLLSPDHAGLVLRVYLPGTPHPEETNTSIPNFPGPTDASTQLNVTRYYRNRGSGHVLPRFDYLNHRGSGKEKAEIIYNATVFEMLALNYEFRCYLPGVRDNWIGWSGILPPPR